MNKNKIITLISLLCLVITTGITVVKFISNGSGEEPLQDIDFEITKADLREEVEAFRTINISEYNEYLASVAEITDETVIDKRNIFSDSIIVLDETVGRCIEKIDEIQTQSSYDEFKFDEDYTILPNLDKSCSDAKVELENAVDAYNKYIQSLEASDNSEKSDLSETPTPKKNKKQEKKSVPTNKPGNNSAPKPAEKNDATTKPATQATQKPAPVKTAPPATAKPATPKQDSPASENTNQNNDQGSSNNTGGRR